MREVRRAEQRFRTVGDGVQTWHSFSYGAHYDPDQISFGPIMAINTEHVAAGRGYDEHDHADVEIVTWVLDGVLRHEDSTGQSGDIHPGTAQRLSAGDGVRHAERNGSAHAPLTFVQMMLRSDHEGAPGYAQVDVPATSGMLVPTVSVHAGAELFAVRLEAGQSLEVPTAPSSLVIVTSGRTRCAGLEVGSFDELRSSGEGPYVLEAVEPAQALVWIVGA